MEKLKFVVKKKIYILPIYILILCSKNRYFYKYLLLSTTSKVEISMNTWITIIMNEKVKSQLTILNLIPPTPQPEKNYFFSQSITMNRVSYLCISLAMSRRERKKSTT